jgi:hypothetical protein
MTDLAAILGAFADGSCPQAVLADFLEDRGDERAERVRAATPHTEEWDATHLGDSHPTYVEVEEDPDSFRGRILRWFPEWRVPLASLTLGVRARKTLLRLTSLQWSHSPRFVGAEFVDELVGLTTNDLLEIHGCGPATAAELVVVLARHGLAFADDLIADPHVEFSGHFV